MTGIIENKYRLQKRKRSQGWERFCRHKRGYISLWLLSILYAVSLCSELICNNKPIWLNYNNRNYFPALFSYTENDILKNGVHSRLLDYTEVVSVQGVKALFPFFRSGVNQTFQSETLEKYRRIIFEIVPKAGSAGIQVDGDGNILYLYGDIEKFPEIINGSGQLPDSIMTSKLRNAINSRLNNESSGLFKFEAGGNVIFLASYKPREIFPASVRVFVYKNVNIPVIHKSVKPDRIFSEIENATYLAGDDKALCLQLANDVLNGNLEPSIQVSNAEVTIELETISWPFRPVPGHPFGFDSGGFDVFARVLYAMRTSMTFGLLLVFTTMILGIIAGGIQGYFAGWIDLTGQRLTEICAAIPFLYVIILLGNTLGRGFVLLLICYAMFNWIGIAAYVRAEFLRLRVHAFVDAARCPGVSSFRIMFRHILPNSLTPLITLFPFSLVGAIGSLVALDYLGFGLPEYIPSWGELLQQAQAFRHAWWLILYPSLALFAVMILGVFIGEGLRDALDPKPYSRME